MTAPTPTQEQLIRADLAALIQAGLNPDDLDPPPTPIHDFAPSTARSNSGYLEFGEPWRDFTGEGTTFTRGLLRLQLILVSPSVDWSIVMPWCSQKIAGVRAALKPKTTVGGILRPMVVNTNPAGIIDKAFAIAVNFSPMLLGENE